MSLDLSALGFRVKKADAEKAQSAPAQISAVIFASGDADTAVEGQKILKAAGLDFPESTIFEDGTVAIHKGDESLEDGTVVRLNSSVAVVLKEGDKHIADLKKSAFADIADEQGYFDGPTQVMSVASDSIRTSLQKADDTPTSITVVRDSMESVSHYMDLITKTLPTAILKSEVRLENLVKSAVLKTPEVAEVVAPVVPSVEATKVEDTEVEKKDKGINPFAKKKPAPDEVEAVEEDDADKKPVEAKKEDDSLAQVLKAVEALATQVATISKSVEGLSGEVKAVQKSTEQKIDVLAKKADTATHAVKGTVISSELPGDPMPLARVKKADSDPRAGIFDTAFIRR